MVTKKMQTQFILGDGPNGSKEPGLMKNGDNPSKDNRSN